MYTRVFETRTATGKEHCACKDSGVSHIILLIISNGGKILINIKVVVDRQVKMENSSIPVAVHVPKTCALNFLRKQKKEIFALWCQFNFWRFGAKRKENYSRTCHHHVGAEICSLCHDILHMRSRFAGLSCKLARVSAGVLHP